MPGKKAEEEAKRSPVDLAFVLLSEVRPPSADEIVSAFAGFAAPQESIAATSSTTRTDCSVLELTFGSGESAFVVFVPAAVPNREADDAAQFSLGAIGTGWHLPPHVAHLVVTVPSPGDLPPVNRLSRFTSLLAAVVQATPSVGVYWGNAGATHGRDFFLAAARDPGIVTRIMLWTGISIAAEDGDRISLVSLGMSQLDLPDLLLVAPRSSFDAALEMFFDLLVYGARRGEPLPEGDTVGRTADEQLPVRYVPSPLGNDTQVCRVELPG